MNEMEVNNRGYDNRDYRSYRNERDYDNRYYDEMEHGYRDSDYRDNYRDYRDYRDSYRDYDNRRRDYDRRGGKINNRDYRNYRNYRNQDYYEELQMTMEDMREQYRKLEDIAEMADNQQDKNMLMKVAQKEKENYSYVKQLAEK